MEAASGGGANGFAAGFIPGYGGGGKTGRGGAVGSLFFGFLGTFIGGYNEYVRQDKLPETFRFPGERPEGELEPIRQWKIDEENQIREEQRDFNNLPAPFDDAPCP